MLKKNIDIEKNTKTIKNKLFIKFNAEPTYQMLNEYINGIKYSEATGNKGIENLKKP